MKFLPWAVAFSWSIFAFHSSADPSWPVLGRSSRLSAQAPVQTQVMLSWAPIPGALCYTVYRGTSPRLMKPVGTNLEGTFYLDQDLDDGTTYYYRVAGQAAGGGGPQSEPVSATTKPAPVKSFNAKAGDGQVTLAWKAVSTAAAYRLYRDTLGIDREATNSFMITGSPVPTTFVDRGLRNGTEYFYQIAPVNGSGENPVTATVTAIPRGPFLVLPGPQNQGQKPLGASPEIRVKTLETSGQSWSGSVSFGLPDEPDQRAEVFVPDLRRPVPATLILTDLNLRDLPGIEAVARSFNLAILKLGPFNFHQSGPFLSAATPDDRAHTIGIIDMRWPELGARRIQMALEAAARQVPSHPELAHGGLVFYGFSEGVDHNALTMSQPSLVTRVLAVIAQSEIDEDQQMPVLTLLKVPHLFVASGKSDFYSSLDRGLESFPSITHDVYARRLATLQGAPLTVFNNPGAGHGENPDHPFISLWLTEVLAQRLAEGLPCTDWNGKDSWVGTYTVAGGKLVNLVDVSVSPRESYVDPRPYTWLPDEKAALAWEAYAEGLTPPSTPSSGH